MSKKYQGKDCVYCGLPGAATTADHVLAREFVLKKHRANLPKVPACTECNSKKAKLEHYLTAMLPFGGQHDDAEETLKTLIPKRLAKNHRLRSELRASSTPVWVPNPSGLWVRSNAVNIDAEKINSLVSMITLGLIWHHWKLVVTPNVEVDPMLLGENGAGYFSQIFKAKSAHQVPETSIGGDALVYKGAQGFDEPELSLWRIEFYAGLQLAGTDPRVRASAFYVTVMPLHLVNSAA